MKCSWLSVILFSVSLASVSCSDNGGDKDQGTNTVTQSSTTPTTSTATATIVPSNAKEKIPDAAVKGLKGKVEVLSESIFDAVPTKTLSLKNVFKYDANGNMTELINYSGDGKLVSTIKTYDANGYPISEETILSNGNVDVRSTIKADTKGNKIEQNDVKADPTGTLFNFKQFYSYDEKGQLVERAAYRDNGAFFYKYGFTYDASGNKTEWTRLGPNNSISGKVVYKYNDKNNLIEQNEYEGASTLKSSYTFTYEYDKKGNWIRQNKIADGKVVEIKERQITYD
jgi:YD repeat-containing protein